MAARTRKALHADEIKRKIQTSQLVNRLQKNGLAKVEFLTAGQILSINSLLDRVIPRLKAVEHSGGIEVATVTKEQRDAAVKAAARANG
jgi:hypothetical protein